jgi:hypothetical protein
MKRRIILEMVVYPLVLTMALFGFVWVKYGGMTIEWALEVTLLSGLTVVSLLFFLARILEKHGYTKSDIRRIGEVLEEHWEEPWDSGYLKHDVQECIAHHLIFWGFFSTALLAFHNVFLTIMMFIGLAFLMAVMYPVFATMVVWIIALPLYFLKGERAKDMFDFIWKTSLAVSLAIPAIWVASTYLAAQNYPAEILKMFNAVVRNADGLLILSIINTLFGFLGVYLPSKTDRRIVTAILFALAVAMLFVLWGILKPEF